MFFSQAFLFCHMINQGRCNRLGWADRWADLRYRVKRLIYLADLTATVGWYGWPPTARRASVVDLHKNGLIICWTGWLFKYVGFSHWLIRPTGLWHIQSMISQLSHVDQPVPQLVYGWSTSKISWSPIVPLHGWGTQRKRADNLLNRRTQRMTSQLFVYISYTGRIAQDQPLLGPE